MPDSRLSVVLLALLACNTAYYVIAGRFSEALDSLAWYVLLILFLVETARSPLVRSATGLTVMRVLRVIAMLAIMVSTALYVMERAWLDAANLVLWTAVVVLLEIEVRYPATLAVRHRAFAATAALLYGALALLVLTWLMHGEWMDAWDGALWLAAFAVLELELLTSEKQKIV
jgi:hypothetical protein